jgi:hypothetical protein
MIKTIGLFMFALATINASAFAGEVTTVKLTVQNPELVKQAIVLMDDSSRPTETGPAIQSGKVLIGSDLQNLSRKENVCFLMADRKADLAKGTQIVLKVSKDYSSTFNAYTQNVAGLKNFGIFCMGQGSDETPLSYSLAHVLHGIFAVELK